MDQLLQNRAINSKELEELLKLRAEGKVDFLLVDVREPSEYRRNHISGVDILKPSSNIFNWIDEFHEEHKESTTIFTCRTGMRSGRIQRFLIDRGLLSVINHAGGIMSYEGKTERGVEE